MIKTLYMGLILILFLGSFEFLLGGEKSVPKDRSPQEVVKYVENAVGLIQKLGEKRAFAELTDPKGKWVQGDWYIYVNNFDGFVVAHLNKKLEGKFLLGIRDVKGNPFFAELQMAAQSKKGHGWVEFWWPKANSKTPVRKLGFAMAVPGKRLWVGTGVYDMSKENIQEVLNKYMK